MVHSVWKGKQPIQMEGESDQPIQKALNYWGKKAKPPFKNPPTNYLHLTLQESQNTSVLTVAHAISNFDLKIKWRKRRSGQKHSISR